MKQRLLTALIGLSAAALWLCSINTPVFSIVMGLFALIASLEMQKAFEVKNIPFRVLCCCLSALIPVYFDYKDRFTLPLYPFLSVIVMVTLIITVLDHKKLSFEQAVSCLFCSTLIPAAMGTTVLFRDVYKAFPTVFTKPDGIFLILFAFFCSWLTDGCALFAGKAFGKHKLAPEISPKKTVEGAIGGVLGNCLFCVGLFYLFKYKFNLSSYITVVWVILSALFLSVLSIFGDLAASAVKRRHGIKDFGNLLPGHGGVMDRFDSSVFVFAAQYAIILLTVH